MIRAAIGRQGGDREGDRPRGSRASISATIAGISQACSIASPTSNAKPSRMRNTTKNSANRMSEMRLAIAEMLVSPSAPATSEMIRKMTVYLNLPALRGRPGSSTDEARPRSPMRWSAANGSRDAQGCGPGGGIAYSGTCTARESGP